MKLAVAMASALISLALTAGAALAATENKAEEAKKEPSAAQKAQQEKMKSCNAQAKSKDLKGDERQTFMKTCLGGSNEGAAKCEAQAAEKKLAGAAKNSFVKKCTADAAATK